AGWQVGATVDVHAEMMALTQAIVGKTLFDADVSGAAHDATQAAKVLAEDFGARLRSFRVVPLWFPTPRNLRSRRAVRRLEGVVDRIIADRVASHADRGDLLSMLVQAQDAADGTRMSARQLRDEVMTIYIAGHETTGRALLGVVPARPAPGRRRAARRGSPGRARPPCARGRGSTAA